MYNPLTNSAEFERVILFAAIGPMVFSAVEIAEQSRRPGPEKRQKVIDVTAESVRILVKQGWLPAELNIAKSVGGLIDTAVVIYNGNGFFKHRNSEKEVRP